MRTIDATFYVQVAPTWGYAYGNVEPPLRGAKVAGVTQSKPGKPKPGSVLVKLTLRLPESAFLPLRPEAVVVVPEDMTAATLIHVEANDPKE